MADSYVTAASQSAGSVAEQAVDMKCQKYGQLSGAYTNVETHGPMDDATVCTAPKTTITKRCQCLEQLSTFSVCGEELRTLRTLNTSALVWFGRSELSGQIGTGAEVS